MTLASEGSHGGFAPRGPLQRELLAFVEDGRLRDADPSLAFDFPCEVEHVACGAGLARIHRFFCAKHGLPHDSLVRPSRAVSRHAQGTRTPVLRVL